MWQFGRYNLAGQWIELPVPLDISKKREEIGGGERGITGAMNFDRNALKRSWPLVLQDYLDESVWRELVGWYEDALGAGPYELQDSGGANMVTDAYHRGIGWVTSAGAVIAAPLDMRLPLNGVTTTAQTGKTAAPTLSSLIPCLPNTVYSAGMSWYSDSNITGTFQLFAYTAAGAVIGQLGATQNVAALTGWQRTKVLNVTTGGTAAYLQARCTRSGGAGWVRDLVVNPGTRDHGPHIRSVRIAEFDQVLRRRTNRRSTISFTLEEI